MRLKKKDVESESAKLEQYKSLMKKGFKTTEDVRIQTSMLAAKELDYSSSKQYLDVKKQYDYRRKTTEYTSKVDQARKRVELAQATARAELLKATSENESAKATEAIEEQQLNEYRKQKEKTVIAAVQEGIVAYANDVYYDASRQIREGATVYFQQKIFSLPDMSRMQVKVNTHESLVKKIKVGTAGRDPDRRLRQHRLHGEGQVGLQSGRLIASLDQRRRQGVSHDRDHRRPRGPRTQARHDRRGARSSSASWQTSWSSRSRPSPSTRGSSRRSSTTRTGIQRRKVKIGESNEQFVEIVDGLTEGETVALDARTRSAAEFKIEESKEPTEKSHRAPRSHPGTRRWMRRWPAAACRG